MNNVIIITRHAGLVVWLNRHGIAGEVVEHVENPSFVAGKHVIGALPMHLAAIADKITVIDLPGLRREKRGDDLTPEEMDAAGATMKTYRVREI